MSSLRGKLSTVGWDVAPSDATHMSICKGTSQISFLKLVHEDGYHAHINGVWSTNIYSVLPYFFDIYSREGGYRNYEERS